jgi:hypothetical protein
MFNYVKLISGIIKYAIRRFSIITGGHTVIYSMSPEADRAFLKDVLKLTHVDVGGGLLCIRQTRMMFTCFI